MYKVIDQEGHVRGKASNLATAMEMAKCVDEFVTISGPDFELCGKFGVDSVENAKLPDGSDYTWTMRRDENHRSWRKKLT